MVNLFNHFFIHEKLHRCSLLLFNYLLEMIFDIIETSFYVLIARVAFSLNKFLQMLHSKVKGW